MSISWDHWQQFDKDVWVREGTKQPINSDKDAPETTGVKQCIQKADDKYRLYDNEIYLLGLRTLLDAQRIAELVECCPPLINMMRRGEQWSLKKAK